MADAFRADGGCVRRASDGGFVCWCGLAGAEAARLIAAALNRAPEARAFAEREAAREARVKTEEIAKQRAREP